MGDNLGWKTVTVITGIPAVHGVVRWRRKDLVQWLFQEFRISLDETTVGRELKALGFTKLSARPRHYAQNELEGELFKKTSQPHWQRSGRNARPERISKSGGPTKPRAKEQDHAPLGTSGNPTVCPARPADHVGLYLRRDLLEKGQGS
ncbi:winged helix-turn-helix domain-containing protein [Rhizobium leguminosarum bv. viciae]|nr:winged helix-turn helix family protein [Rhizobium leguminosarum bv. viciae]PUB61354.1 hypothetical protein DB728_28150 [Rhizobium leguminosarum bv. viciae USDA 2370]AVC52566.1 winged helix-turn helix family protein [Rhizobium leguminosarum bv. viciae]NKJ84809.1 hypothetical protein [Rhizobium leguminosarum bv. viciae]NKK54342.1 hypothetical protein [Rhizobium leguminosarum bv. viciae]